MSPLRHELWVLVGALAASACVVQSNNSHEWVRKRASQDFSCPMGSITVYHYTDKPHEKGAMGCGKEMVYVERCQGGDCRWIAAPSKGPPKRPK
ncbi:MAG: hypothetical protein IT377_16675 [Polyangiaceae bacterium]|nr:hypothetical protein [Polyangiaceae bacterium]